MQFTRRTLLATACATPLLSLPHDAADAAVRATAGLCTKSRFLPLVGTDFLLRDGDAAHLAVLVGVDDLPGVDADERCFALEFALAGAVRPGQATFEVVHPGLPRFAALAAPSTMAGDRLVAVFNSPA
jgi:hypothetical protein